MGGAAVVAIPPRDSLKLRERSSFAAADPPEETRVTFPRQRWLATADNGGDQGAVRACAFERRGLIQAALARARSINAFSYAIEAALTAFPVIGRPANWASSSEGILGIAAIAAFFIFVLLIGIDAYMDASRVASEFLKF